MANLKRGSRVFIRGFDMRCRPILVEPATVIRAVPMTKHDGADYPGFYLVRCEDGARIVHHESRLSLGNYA